MARVTAIARVSLVVLLLGGLAGLSACGGGGSAKTARTSGSTTLDKGTACGRVAPGSASYRHVIWIWMENQDYDNVIGASSAPYLSSLAADCGLATNYHNITHPSLPNYIAATSGLGGKKLNPFYGDCEPNGYCSTRLESIFTQVRSWRAYEESMPTPCAGSDDGLYAARHNPPIYYRSLTGCRERDLPLTALPGDLASDSLPAFSFVTPNLCHDTHDCPVSQGDDWLANEIPHIIQSPAYRAGHTVLFITYDEGEGGSATACATNQSDVGCRVLTVILSPSTPTARRSDELFNHYSLLRTTEDLLRVAPLGRAKAARSMAKSFGL